MVDTTSSRDALPPLFRPRVQEDSPVLEKPSELRRQSSPGVFQHFNSLPDSEMNVSKRNGSLGSNHQPKIVIDLEVNAKRPQPVRQDAQLLAAAPDPSIAKSVQKSRSKTRQKRHFVSHRTNVVAPSFDDEPLSHSSYDHDSFVFQRMERNSQARHLIRSTTLAEEPMDHQAPRDTYSRRHSDNESIASSSGVDESIYTSTIVPAMKPGVSSSSPQNTSSESNPPGCVYHISGKLVEEDRSSDRPATRASKKPPKLKGSGRAKRNKLTKAQTSEEVRPLSSTSTRITEAKANHFNSPSSPAVLNLGNLLDEPDPDRALDL